MAMQRRSVVLAAGGVLVLRPVALAQQQERVARIGWLGLASNDPALPSVPLEGLRAGLRQRGWVEGRNLVIEGRSGGFDNAEQLVAELLQAKVSLIVAEGGMIFRARSLAGATPVLFHVNGDPVLAKLVESYAHPGGTLTGMTNLSAELSGKRVELLKAALPHMTRCAAIANQSHPGWQVESEATRAAAQRLKLELTWHPVYAPRDFDAAFDAVARSGAQGLIAVPDNLILSQARSIGEFGVRHAIPAISGLGEFTDAGNLMSYGPVQRDAYAKLGEYADKLLRGAKPSDLPVENPVRFELIFNLKVARVLKLKVPQPMLLRADRVIE